jgi:PAS domain S-box-containing protein
MRPVPSSEKLRRSWPVAAVLSGIVGLQVLLAVVSIDVLSSVRAYVAAESRYSKGQKDAQLRLLAYAHSHRLEDYRMFLQAIAAPLASRRAREALQQSPPNLALARQAGLESGENPADLDGMIRLFLWFERTPFMAGPIATWTEADRVIGQIVALAERAHSRLEAGEGDAPEVLGLLEQAMRLDRRMTELERRFSAQLGGAARRSADLLLVANLALAFVLVLAGLGFLRQNLRARAVAENEVRRRQETLQLLLDSTAEGLYGVDLDGRCTFINRSALRLLGYEHESELLGRRVHDLIHHRHADGRPYPAEDCRMYRAYRRGTAAHVVDEVFWRRDGVSFPVEYWSHPVLQDGRVRGAVATFFDITERLRTQSALHESEQRLSRLVDTVADGVIAIDADEQVVLFNRAAERMFGVPAEQALGGPVERFIPQPLRARHHELIGRYAMDTADMLRMRGASHELTGLRANGEVFPMEGSLSKLETDQGLVMTVVLRDMSERFAMRDERKAREALEAANRAKTEFLSRMSHELRTPLNAVLGFAQLMRLDRESALGPAQQLRAQRIEEAGMHLLALVNDVLDLSRVESGRMSLSLEAVDLRAVADEAIELMQPLADDARVGIRKGFDRGAAPADDAWVLADRVRLRQVLVNLLANAVKYNRPGGHVMVDCAADGATVDCTVADDGPGMTAEQLANLFQPFNRLGAERTAVQGTGIGLVLSRHMVGLMHGTLSIDSAPGSGTLATVRLQRAGRPVVPAMPPFAPSAHGPLAGARSVLYAEDNPVNVEIVREVLALRPGLRLRVATNGAEALAMARAEPPELMLVDMHLGDMTGLELARALRSDAATAAIRLVALSADALPDQVSTALRAGFESYLTKPFVFKDLLKVVDDAAGP